MATNTFNELQTLRPSARTIREGSAFSDEMIEDYLTLLENIINIAQNLDGLSLQVDGLTPQSGAGDPNGSIEPNLNRFYVRTYEDGNSIVREQWYAEDISDNTSWVIIGTFVEANY